MSVFKDELETKRVIFNVSNDLAMRLEACKEDARGLGKKLDADSAVDKALEKFLKKAEKKLEELRGKSEAARGPGAGAPRPEPAGDPDDADRLDPASARPGP